MKIIIPMTGYGTRFVAAGYKDLKPFIKVGGVPIIEWIVRGMYSGEKDFLFICRQEHLDNKSIQMKERLMSVAPSAKIFAIKDWVKKGPVYDVLQAKERIDDRESCIVNYCDFYMTWDYETFKKEVSMRNCAGAVPCYSGFHPHLLKEKNLYASCKVDAKDNLLEIREKYSFEPDKLSARHSPGVYYFQSGALLKEYCKKLISGGPAINGEYYASLPYNYMVNDGLKVWCPVNVNKFCQWGTPEDLQEYEFWIGRIKGLMMEKVDDKDVGTRKKWHSGFKEALIVQFEPYHDVLEFDFEHKLTSEALRIDAVIIKKKDEVQIENDIGCNFHKYNILEYKSPEDYFSIKDLWKTMSYAYLYASIENDVEPDSITVTIIRTGGSKSVLKYLKNRGYDVEEKVDDKKQETGIYLVKGLCLPLQIIDSEKLPEEGNLWLKNLRGNLDVATLQKILEESGKGGRLPMLEAFLQVVSEANEQGIEEVLKMRSAKLDEIFHRNGYLTIEEVEAERKQAEAERKTEREQAEAERKQAEAQRQAFEATLRSLGLPSDQIAAALRV